MDFYESIICVIVDVVVTVVNVCEGSNYSLQLCCIRISVVDIIFSNPDDINTRSE